MIVLRKDKNILSLLKSIDEAGIDEKIVLEWLDQTSPHSKVNFLDAYVSYYGRLREAHQRAHKKTA